MQPAKFCKAPFKSLVIDTDGSLLPCCEFMSHETNISKYKDKFIKASKLLNHRGPDNQNFKFNKNEFFFHSRLSIIDLSNKSNQPFVSKDGRYSLLYNGEIYNHKELSKKLTISS